MKSNNLFKWKHYHADIIILTIRWYLKYNLSFRKVLANGVVGTSNQIALVKKVLGSPFKVSKSDTLTWYGYKLGEYYLILTFESNRLMECLVTNDVLSFAFKFRCLGEIIPK
jgi:hypothetical protein